MSEDRERYAKGLPGYHDPTANWAGAPEAISALTARLVFAAFGLVCCVIAVVLFAVAGVGAGWIAAAAVVGAVLIVDIVVIVRRKLRGEPG